jgi:hypothetical protein
MIVHLDDKDLVVNTDQVVCIALTEDDTELITQLVGR